MASEVLALIPARAGSKGVPGKNFAALAGVSPLERAARCCVSAGLRVVISTDGAIPNGYVVPARFLARPAAFATDSSPMIDVVKHALGEIPGPPDQIILLVQPTQPLRQPRHLRAAIELLRGMEFDSVTSLTPIPRTHAPEFVWSYSDTTLTGGFWLEDSRLFDQRPTRRQDVPWPYVRDGTVYAFWRRTVEQFGDLYGDIKGAIVIPPEETCSLDTPSDWLEAERRLRALSGLPVR